MGKSKLTITGDMLKNGQASDHSQGADNTEGEKQPELKDIWEADRAW